MKIGEWDRRTFCEMPVLRDQYGKLVSCEDCGWCADGYLLLNRSSENRPLCIDCYRLKYSNLKLFWKLVNRVFEFMSIK